MNISPLLPGVTQERRLPYQMANVRPFIDQTVTKCLFIWEAVTSLSVRALLFINRAGLSRILEPNFGHCILNAEHTLHEFGHDSYSSA